MIDWRLRVDFRPILAILGLNWVMVKLLILVEAHRRFHQGLQRKGRAIVIQFHMDVYWETVDFEVNL